MIKFTTVLLVVSILVWPVVFVVKLFSVKKVSDDMCSGDPGSLSAEEEELLEYERLERLHDEERASD